MIPHLSLLLLSAVLLACCAPLPKALPSTKPTSVETTTTHRALRDLPAPAKAVPVAVYNYPDLTGQFKSADTYATSSRAVTQGAVWMLVKSLKDAGAGRWFKVIQRANLDYLLKERQIIRETRGRMARQSGQPQPGLPSLLFAGLILDGGIIGYDSNTVTGGLGARYLGIGGDTQYRQDTVTVYLNAISSQTGEIVKSVMTRKTVVSYGVRGSVFKFVSFQKLLEGEAGFTVNEPGQIALAQAIDHAVHALVIEGTLEGLWRFENQEAGALAAELYLADKDEDLMLASAAAGHESPRTNAQLERMIEIQKEKRAQILARRAAVEEQLGVEAARGGDERHGHDNKPDGDARHAREKSGDAFKINSSSTGTVKRMNADTLEALLKLLIPFRTETRRLVAAQRTLSQTRFTATA